MYDDAYKYGQNFYLCLTEEAKERVMKVRKMLTYVGRGIDGQLGMEMDT